LKQKRAAEAAAAKVIAAKLSSAPAAVVGAAAAGSGDGAAAAAVAAGGEGVERATVTARKDESGGVNMFVVLSAVVALGVAFLLARILPKLLQ
jgi:hypothetical protein